MCISFYRVLAPIALLSQTACGGGSSSVTTQPDFLDPAAIGTVTIAAVLLNSGTRSTNVESGTLNQSTNRFNLGALTGSIDEERTQVVLSSGGLIRFETGDNAFSAFYEATPTTGNRTVGAIGLATAGSEMPNTGGSSYTGTASVTIQDDGTVYDLTGDASIIASFGANGTVTSKVSNLSGTQTIGLTAPSKVADVGTISFTDSTISGTTFVRGTPSINSGTISDLSGTEVSSFNGAFFGPTAIEAGAAFVIDDSAKGTVAVFGALLTD